MAKKIDDMTIGEARKRLEEAKQEVIQLSELFGKDVDLPENSDMIGEIGRAVIVRSKDQGVVFGRYQGNNGSTIHLSDARQVWSWTAKRGGTLLDVANYGISKGKLSTANKAVTVFNACGLIDCTEEAEKILTDWKVDFS